MSHKIGTRGDRSDEPQNFPVVLSHPRLLTAMKPMYFRLSDWAYIIGCTGVAAVLSTIICRPVNMGFLAHLSGVAFCGSWFVSSQRVYRRLVGWDENSKETVKFGVNNSFLDRYTDIGATVRLYDALRSDDSGKGMLKSGDDIKAIAEKILKEIAEDDK